MNCKNLTLFSKKFLSLICFFNILLFVDSVEADADLISAEDRKDFSALNAIRLTCSDDSEAVSLEGLRGKWTEFMRCQGKRDYIHGVRLKSEPWKGWGKIVHSLKVLSLKVKMYLIL